jgi:hypothetical protein
VGYLPASIGGAAKQVRQICVNSGFDQEKFWAGITVVFTGGFADFQCFCGGKNVASLW